MNQEIQQLLRPSLLPIMEPPPRANSRLRSHRLQNPKRPSNLRISLSHLAMIHCYQQKICSLASWVALHPKIQDLLARLCKTLKPRRRVVSLTMNRRGNQSLGNQKLRKRKKSRPRPNLWRGSQK